MNSTNRAPSPSLAHILKHESEELIIAVDDGDILRVAEILATIDEITHHVQLSMDREIVASTSPACWMYNGNYIYPEHTRSPQIAVTAPEETI